MENALATLAKDWARDFRQAARKSLKNPAFTATAIVTLALGIGANTSIFSVANAVLFRSLPYRDADRLVRLLADNPELGFRGAGLAPGDFADFRRQSRTLEGLSAYQSTTAALTGGERPEVVRAALVSPSLFSLLDARPRHGRLLLSEEEAPGRDHVAVVSEGFWRRRFGGGWEEGKTLQLDGEPYTVVGVLDRDFRFPRADIDLWAPLDLSSPDQTRWSHYLGAIARLAPGQSAEQANQEMERLSEALEGEHPDSNKGWRAVVRGQLELMVAPVRPALLALLAGVGLVLLIAGANFASLLLARSLDRGREAALRAVLGASRRRLLRLYLAESLVLAFLGGGLGLALAAWAVPALVAAQPDLLPRSGEIAVDWAAFAYALVLAVAVGVGFGSLPAWRASRANLNDALRSEAGSGKGGTSRTQGAAFLIVVEVAVATVLLVGAGLMLKGSYLLGGVDPGFEADNAAALKIILPGGKYPGDSEQIRFFEAVVDGVRNLPGVSSAAATSSIPLDPRGWNALPFQIEGFGKTAAEGVFADFSAVTPEFFQTLEIPLAEGRFFTDLDDADHPPVAIVNQTMARQFWAADTPSRRKILLTARGSTPTSHEVVGVVGDVRNRSMDAEPGPAIYVPFRQLPHSSMAVVFRSRAGTPAPIQEAQLQVWDVDPEQPIREVWTLNSLMADSTARNRLYTTLFLAFGGLGLALAAIGVYGIISQAISRRSMEMAIRMALGATGGRLRAMVVGEGFKFAGLGIAIGLLGAWVVSRFLSTLLFGVSARDPWVYAGVAVFLMLVAVAAAYLPAHRASSSDPLDALRRN